MSIAGRQLGEEGKELKGGKGRSQSQDSRCSEDHVRGSERGLAGQRLWAALRPDVGSPLGNRLWMYHLEATISTADITVVPSKSSQELVLTAKSLRTVGGADAH